MPKHGFTDMLEIHPNVTPDWRKLTFLYNKVPTAYSFLVNDGTFVEIIFSALGSHLA